MSDATHRFSPLVTGTESNAFDNLGDIHKRYMLNPHVAQWLLSRDAHSDLEVVRKENSLLTSVTTSSHPEVIPDHVPDAPFPVSNDLMFLDHTIDTFALGHVRCKRP